MAATGIAAAVTPPPACRFSSATTRSGQAERAALIDAEWPGERGRLAALLGRGGFRLDDLHDAFAALWTARRIRDGVARTLPSCPQRDGRGLAMEIVV